jgi:UDP-N-acetylmuramoyl-tripeptide--D-alanyl-D-alanine ligase
MTAALSTLAAVSATRHVAVLGEMAELAQPARDHLAIAELAASLDIELIAVGTTLYGVEPVTPERAIELLADLGARDAALVKGSRVAALERVIAAVV